MQYMCPHLKVWTEREKECLSCAVEAITDLKGLRSQCSKNLTETDTVYTNLT